MKILNEDFTHLLNISLKEDLFLNTKLIDFKKDITTNAFIDSKKKKNQAEAYFIAKEEMVICGLPFLKYFCKNFLKDFKCKFLVKEGDIVQKGTNIIFWQADIAKILLYERSILNIIQYLCGISTGTRKIVEITKKVNSQIKVLDTRKILPGFRHLAKYAVKIGGGHNHRIGLYDMFLIKDNHWQLAEKNNFLIEDVVKKMSLQKKKIEIECSNKNQVIFLLEKKVPVDIIMLDNMNIIMIKKMITLIKEYNFKNKKKIKIEVSGNLDKNKISKFKNLEIDYISLGKLTHSVISSDISLNIV